MNGHQMEDVLEINHRALKLKDYLDQSCHLLNKINIINN